MRTLNSKLFIYIPQAICKCVHCPQHNVSGRKNILVILTQTKEFKNSHERFVKKFEMPISINIFFPGTNFKPHTMSNYFILVVLRILCLTEPFIYLLNACYFFCSCTKYLMQLRDALSENLSIMT